MAPSDADQLDHGNPMLPVETPFDLGPVEYENISCRVLRDLTWQRNIAKKPELRHLRKLELATLLHNADSSGRICEPFPDPYQEVNDRGRKEGSRKSARLSKATAVLAKVKDDASTESPCQLLSLPPELRLMIFRFVVTTHQSLFRPQQPVLTRTCRQVRAETLPIFYSENSFALQISKQLSPIEFCPVERAWQAKFRSDIIHPHDHAWLSSIRPANVAMIRSITLLRNLQIAGAGVEGWERVEMYKIDLRSVQGGKIHLHATFEGEYRKCHKSSVTHGLYHIGTPPEGKVLKMTADCQRQEFNLRVVDVELVLKKVGWILEPGVLCQEI